MSAPHSPGRDSRVDFIADEVAAGRRDLGEIQRQMAVAATDQKEFISRNRLSMLKVEELLGEIHAAIRQDASLPATDAPDPKALAEAGRAADAMIGEASAQAARILAQAEEEAEAARQELRALQDQVEEETARIRQEAEEAIKAREATIAAARREEESILAEARQEAAAIAERAKKESDRLLDAARAEAENAWKSREDAGRDTGPVSVAPRYGWSRDQAELARRIRGFVLRHGDELARWMEERHPDLAGDALAEQVVIVLDDALGDGQEENPARSEKMSVRQKVLEQVSNMQIGRPSP